MTRVLILNKRDVESLLSMPACVELMSGALASLARGQVALPLRPVIRIPETHNAFAVMPAHSQSLRALGAKLISVFPGNHGTAVDSHQGLVVLFDGENGSPRAIMDAASITAIRTAAVSGVATRLLSRRGAETLAILGAGVQARTHLDAMMAVHPFRRVLVWTRTRAHASAFVESVQRRHEARIEVAENAEDAVRPADVICTVTAAREPVLKGAWLRKGAHVNAVGASLPTTRELDSEAVRRARVFVDRRESAMNEAGDLLIPMKEGAVPSDCIAGEIGEIVNGQAQGRRSEEEITLFKSLGLAIEDLACAHHLHERATADGAGTWIEL